MTMRSTITNEDYEGTDMRYVEFNCGHAAILQPDEAPEIGGEFDCMMCPTEALPATTEEFTDKVLSILGTGKSRTARKAGAKSLPKVQTVQELADSAPPKTPETAYEVAVAEARELENVEETNPLANQGKEAERAALEEKISAEIDQDAAKAKKPLTAKQVLAEQATTVTGKSEKAPKEKKERTSAERQAISKLVFENVSQNLGAGLGVMLGTKTPKVTVLGGQPFTMLHIAVGTGEDRHEYRIWVNEPTKSNRG